jgi:hypothetical protein
MVAGEEWRFGSGIVRGFGFDKCILIAVLYIRYFDSK